MANFVYNTAAKEIANGDIDLVSDTIKLMLVDSSYTADKDHDVVDAGGANDPIDAEIDLAAAGYEKGWNQAGRHAITATKVWTANDTDDRAEFDGGDPSTWTGLGPSGTDVDAAILIKEGASNDTTSRLIAYYDTVSGSPSLPFTPTGGDFSLTVGANGLIHLNT